MTRLLPRLFIASALLASTSLAGCGRTEAIAPGHPQVSAYDLEFITNLYNVVEFDREIIGNELARTHDPRVSMLASDLLRQANELAARVKPIADRDGIIPPERVTFQKGSNLQARIVASLGSRTYNYDQEFVSDEISSHEEALRHVQEMAQEPSGDPDLKAISRQADGILIANLGRLNDLQKQLVASSN